ncbi:S24 family peptidase [Pragia fontium]|uniref:S24 family peptidase n=1 Tax=Pragia fontium TaxID=82985 RepID=UPI00064ABE64|nr:S24 family peptidase [Pragia fontium]AKJ41532.1 hypothetical protein QQ39_05080 [Pragia fontium]
MDTLGDRILSRRTELEMTQEDLSKKTGLSRMAISKLEMGITRTARGDNLFTIAEALKCSPHWLLTGKDKVFPSFNQNETQVDKGCFYQYPKIDWTDAAGRAEGNKPNKNIKLEEWRPTNKNVGNYGFWLEVKGDSMTSPSGVSFPQGSMILVNPGSKSTAGEFVIVKLISTNDVTFKMFIEDAGEQYLKSLNAQYPMIKLDNNHLIIGTVVEMVIDL